MRHDQAADDGEAQRTPRLAARTKAERDRKAAHQRRHRGHHDRTEAGHARLENRFVGRQTFLALSLDGEVDHHDRVFFDDADQHDDADERVHVELDAEDQQRHQCAEASGR